MNPADFDRVIVVRKIPTGVQVGLLVELPDCVMRVAAIEERTHGEWAIGLQTEVICATDIDGSRL